MRNVLVFSSLFILIMSCTQTSQEYVTIPDDDVVFAPHSYVCYRTPVPIRVDGTIDEQSWLQTAWSVDFKDIEGGKKPEPRYRTRVKMLWDDDYLYFAAELEEPDIWATLQKRDTVIFYDNDFEIFIDPDGDTHEYYEFEMNAFGTQWDLLLTKPYRDQGRAVNAWDIKGIQVGVKIYGTINDPTIKDQKWTLEIAMPWKILKECAPEGRRPESGEQWRMNFSRVEWDVEVQQGKYVKKTDPKTGNPLPENNWVWSPQGLINMHLPELWGFVQFTDVMAGTSETAFVENPEEHIKWELRKLYYRQTRFFESNGFYATGTEDPGIISGAVGSLNIQTTSRMYEMSMPATGTGKRWYIRQDGLIWKQ